MLFVIVALFAFCWLPYQLYNILREVFPKIDKYKYINIIWFCTHWLAMSNSCYNPFIYAIYNRDRRAPEPCRHVGAMAPRPHRPPRPPGHW
ncbi:hypothetical protein MRX96_034786 [Rhipicephalus microplus]